MSQHPLVSVLLPVHNGERYLSKAVQSILDQTFSNFELLILDDGSSDGSLPILRSLEASDARIRVWTRENRGLVETLNELIDNSHGKYLARMDCDDVSLPNRFEKQVAHLENCSACVAVGCRVQLIDQTGMAICDFIYELTHDEIDAAHISGRGRSCICHPTAMMRREVVLRVGKYRQGFLHAEDLDLFLRLAEVGNLENLPDVHLQYRQHPNAIGSKFGMVQARAALSAVGAARRRRGLEQLSGVTSTKNQSKSGVADAHRKWAWWALMAGNVATARKHTFKAVVQDPLSRDNLKLAACAIRGH
jgi:glycosyltransferase involved in cell wall biosynthesis